MEVKYNIYYSTSPEGPWTLASEVPIDHNDLGNSFQITGLRNDTKYYVSIVGGRVVGSEFLPLVTQPIGPLPEKASGVGVVTMPPWGVKTFEPRVVGSASLKHSIAISIV
jgi:hypothetical protein